MDLVPNGHAVPGVQKAEGSLAPGSSPWHHHGILPSPPHLMPYLCPQSPHSIPWTLSQSSYGCRFPFLSVCITLHHVTSHYITLHHITLDYVTFRYIGYITLHTLHHIHRISTYLTFKRLVGHKPHTETKKVQAQWGRQFSLTQETGNLGVGWGGQGGASWRARGIYNIGVWVRESSRCLSGSTSMIIAGQLVQHIPLTLCLLSSGRYVSLSGEQPRTNNALCLR